MTFNLHRFDDGNVWIVTLDTRMRQGCEGIAREDFIQANCDLTDDVALRRADERRFSRQK